MKVVKIKKQTAQKRKLKFENYKNYIEEAHLENKINDLEKKKKIDINSFLCYKRKHKEFIRKSKLILKTQQRPKSEKHSVFTEEINKIAISSNDDKRMKSIDSTETYAYETRSSTGQKMRFSIKDLFSECDQIHSLSDINLKNP